MNQFTISFLHIYIFLVLEAVGFRFNSLVTHKTELDVNKSIKIKIHLLKGVSSKSSGSLRFGKEDTLIILLSA